MSRLSREKYETIQQHLVVAAQFIAQEHLDLDAFLEDADRADAFGPLLDPTLWMRGHKKLDAVRALARAAKVFRDEVLRQRDAELAAKAAGAP